MFRKRPPSNVVKFRRPKKQRSWTRPSDYGVQPARFAAPRPSGWKRIGGWMTGQMTGWRPFLLLVALITLYVLARDGILPLPAFGDVAEEKVAARFTLCADKAAGENCVVDGDTLRMGARTIRLSGVDTAEMAGSCEAEKTLARVQRAALLEWVNRGPFTLRAQPGEDTDRYGRALRDLVRNREDGSRSMASTYLLEKGARAYEGEARSDWC